MINDKTYTLGKVGMVIRGAYDASTSYEEMDVVSYSGNSYVARTANSGVLPTDAEKWMLIAQGSTTTYSTEEQDTGKRWIDGKTIYRKVLTAKTASAANVAVVIPTGIIAGMIDQLITLRGIVKNGTGEFRPLPHTHRSNLAYGYALGLYNQTQVTINPGSGNTVGPSIVIMEYTRTA